MRHVFDLHLVAGPTGFVSAAQSLSSFSTGEIRAGHDSELSSEEYSEFVGHLAGDQVRPVFLWMIRATLEVKAPTHWWKQATAYFPDVQWIRADEPGANRRLTQSNFEEPIPNRVLQLLNEYAEQTDRDAIRRLLPDSFIRRALVQTEYLTLRTSYSERLQYRSGHWRLYCDSLTTLPYNRLLTEDNRGNISATD